MKSNIVASLIGYLTLQALTLSFVGTQNFQGCSVTTKLGKVQGKEDRSRNGKRYCSFLGIPYANKPKRFEEATMVGHWDSPKTVTDLKPKCPQMGSTGVVGDEDCLYLNVYLPLDNQCQGIIFSANDPLPVLAHIHGGAYMVGSGGEFDPKYIMGHCILFVSLNYRLGALGFLTTNDGHVPGNLGLKDIVLALKWNKENIASFNGDPNSVTLIGISSGSAAIITLVASPAAKGLFHRAIAISGSAISPMFTARNPTKRTLEIAKRLKCTVNDNNPDTAGIKQCLLKAAANDIVANQFLFKWNHNPLIGFGPVVENLKAANPIQTVDAYYNLQSGNINNVPLIMGFTENEGASFEAFPILLQPELVNDLNTKWEEIAPICFNYDEDHIPVQERNTFSKKIRQFYFGDKNVSMENKQSLIDLHSDRYMVQGIFDAVELHSRFASVYPYVFSYKKGFCPICNAGYPQPVSTHGQEVQFAFLKPDEYPEIPKGSPLEEYSDALLFFWITFARTGQPSATWPVDNIIKPYKSNGENYNWYDINEQVTKVDNYLKGRRDFWKNLGLTKYDNPIHAGSNRLFLFGAKEKIRIIFYALLLASYSY